jgi:hypothetical protein
MSDPYAQQKAIAQSMLEAEARTERAQILELLHEIKASLKKLESKPKKEDKE